LIVNGLLAASNVQVQVRSYDGNTESQGTVDIFDGNDALAAENNPNADPCWNLDWTGGVTGSDYSLFLMPHYAFRHHAPRHLDSPNGGEAYDRGDNMAVSWLAGGGAQSFVTLGLRRDSSLGTVSYSTLSQDVGSVSWAVPSGVVAGT